MKKVAVCLAAGVLCLALAGCAAAPAPEKAADGTDWSEDWVTVGGVLGVDTPEGMEPQENNEALAANGMYYATWSMGEGAPCVNEDGDEAQVYDVQVYLLLSSAKSGQEAENTLAQWRELAKDRYAIEETYTQVRGGQEFTVITYTFDSDANPYARGASAFGLYRSCAINVELACRGEFDGDAAQLLTGFLDNCHYAAP